MDYSLKLLLKQTCQIAPLSSRNDHNDFTYGTNVSNACRIEYDTKVIKTKDGRDVISSCQIYVNGDATVTSNSRITLPDSSTPVILHIQDYPDEYGVSYYKCIFC